MACGPTVQESEALAASSRDPWGAAEAEQQVAAGRQPPAPAGLHLWPEQELVHEAEPEEEELQDGGSGREAGAAAGPDVQRCVGGACEGTQHRRRQHLSLQLLGAARCCAV